MQDLHMLHPPLTGATMRLAQPPGTDQSHMTAYDHRAGDYQVAKDSDGNDKQ